MNEKIIIRQKTRSITSLKPTTTSYEGDSWVEIKECNDDENLVDVTFRFGGHSPRELERLPKENIRIISDLFKQCTEKFLTDCDFYGDVVKKHEEEK